MATLLTTKLHLPSQPPNRVERSHLIHQLNTGLENSHHIFLVSAPAGFGKTVCISEWVNTLADPVAWLSLDSADDDPGRFFTYFIAALQNVDRQIGHEIEGILRAGQLPPEEIITTTFVNDILGTKKRFLLVLDDFQMIQDVLILTVLEKLIANLPEALSLVLLTREDPPLPLARLRANNQMTEIRARDLRFSTGETEQFLQEVMGLSLSQDDICALEAKTEGWAAGLHLAGLSIKGQVSPSDFISKLSGSQRFILSYLTEEVLNQQPEDIQRFLLETSILDRLNANLCNAVTGRTDSASMLEKLFADNLFLISLDDEGNWYRYHHLFADLLRDTQYKQHKEDTTELHRRANRWYAQNGMVNEAIQHALDGAEYETAIHLIENHAMDLLMQWHVKTVEGWMQAVPAEWIAQSPKANLVFAWLFMMRGNPAPAFPYLERLERMFSTPQAFADDPALTARWLVLQAMLLNAQGKAKESLTLTHQALGIVPKADVLTLSQIYLGMANAYQQLNDYPHALDAFQKITRHSKQAGNSFSEMLGIAGMALFAIQQGELHFAFEIVSEGIERMEHSGVLPPISTALYGELGDIYYQWHQLDRAHENFQKAIKVSTLSGFADAELYYGVIISRLFQIAGNLEDAAREIQKTVNLMQVEAPSVVGEEIIAQQVRVCLAQGHLAAAEAALKNRGFRFGKQFSFPELEENVTRPKGVLYVSALRVLLHRAKTRNELDTLRQGVALASRLIEDALKHQYTLLALELLLLRAQSLAVLGDEQASQKDYLQALRLGEPEGFISVFVEGGTFAAGQLSGLLKQADRSVDAEFIQRILDAFAADGQPASHTKPEPASVKESLIAPLSERELEILQLIGEGLSNQEITKRLFITLHTVKKHSSNLYAKLGVSSRTQAVARARQLGLL